MTLAFDTGVSTALLTELATWVRGRLEPLRLDSGEAASADGRGPYLRTVQRIGDVPTENSHAWRFVQGFIGGGMPAVFFVIGDGRAETEGAVAWQLVETITIHVYCTSAHATDLVQGRHELATVATDNRFDPGLDAITQHVLEQLMGEAPTTTPPAAPLMYHRRRPWVSGQDLDMVELTFSTRAERVIRPDRATTDTIDAIHATHDVQDGGVIAEQRKTYP